MGRSRRTPESDSAQIKVVQSSYPSQRLGDRDTNTGASSNH